MVGTVLSVILSHLPTLCIYCPVHVCSPETQSPAPDYCLQSAYWRKYVQSFKLRMQLLTIYPGKDGSLEGQFRLTVAW